MLKRLIITVFTLTLILNAEESRENTNPAFADFSGVCHGAVEKDFLWGSALGWDRLDVAWGNLEKEKGIWDEAYFQKIKDKILTAKSKGVSFLPILDYAAPWAGESPDQTFMLSGKKHEIKKESDGSYLLKVFSPVYLDGADGWEVSLERKISAHRMSTRWLNQDHVLDWENYVRKVVSELRQEPYSLEYFQIWNEAWPTSSFWYGDMDAYMTRIHMPAARIIHELGGKVVYGGWICGTPIREFTALLDKHNAWETIDVYDVHYFPLAAMETFYREMQQRGMQDRGLWQTELGFTSDPNFIGNLYPRVLHWALSRNWDWRDKFKLFYFAYGTPNDPKAYGYKRGLLLGNELNLSGRSLTTLSSLLSGDRIELYSRVESRPRLQPELNEKLSSMETFKVGFRIISAVHILPNNNAKIFIDWNGGMDSIHIDYERPGITLSFPALAADQIEKVERVSMYGSTLDLTSRIKPEAFGVSILVPIREPDLQEFRYTDMPESFLPEVFYTVIHLKH